MVGIMDRRETGSSESLIPDEDETGLPHKSKEEKRNRRSGVNTEKPYISSSLGDMVRHMFRLACTARTVGMTIPPPPDFYNFWRRYDPVPTVLPTDLVDMKTHSIARLKVITSSFDFFQMASSSVDSLADDGQQPVTKLESRPGSASASRPESAGYRRKIKSQDSKDTLFSSSTKISDEESIPLGSGWPDGNDAYTPSESSGDEESIEMEAFETVRGIKTMANIPGAGSNSTSTPNFDEDPMSEEDLKRAAAEEERLNQERLAQEIADREKEDEIELLSIPSSQEENILWDTISYGELDDAVFTSNFDFFNEDKFYGKLEEHVEEEVTNKPIEKEIEEPSLVPEAKISGLIKHLESKIKSDSSSEEEGSDASRAAAKAKSKAQQEAVKPLEGEELKAFCRESRKRKIEDNIRRAVRKRSPMGSYIANPPLTKTYYAIPGPKYMPKYNFVKPSNRGPYIAGRWKKSLFKSDSPGPIYNVPPECKCTMVMLNNHLSQRFEKSETDSPGPCFNPSKPTGSDKPKALIVSRKKTRPKASDSVDYKNLYGMTRFGRANPPRPVLIGRYYPKEKFEPGPGRYDIREGIHVIGGKFNPEHTTKSLVPLEPTGIQPYLPVNLDKGPAFAFGIRKFDIGINKCSPGPIYALPETRRKPVSLTFKPFPIRGKEKDTRNYDVKYNAVLRNPPRAVLAGKNFPPDDSARKPGPYFIKEPRNTKGPTLKGRWKDKKEVLPGPADYHPNLSNFKKGGTPVFQGRFREEKPELTLVGFSSPGHIYDPNFSIYMKRVIGGRMYPRWKTVEKLKDDPPFVDLSGFTRYGKYSTLPLSLKSRHTPFKYNPVSSKARHPDTKPCVKPITFSALPTDI